MCRKTKDILVKRESEYVNEGNFVCSSRYGVIYSDVSVHCVGNAIKKRMYILLVLVLASRAYLETL